tara:strand:- start:31281 stop:33818 length:2538 start_codon:yes stop_codon:yes gene_type:complete
VNYFELINNCIVRKPSERLNIEHIQGLEGYVLKQISDNPIKEISINFKYDILSQNEVKFIFGASTQRETFIEIPLLHDKTEFNIKINLKNKIITGDVHQSITKNIRSIQWAGILLNDSAIEISPFDFNILKEIQPEKITKTKIKAPLVCLLTKDSESTIKEDLAKLEKEFKKSNWSLIIADINSADKTYDIIQSHNSTAQFYHYFQFDSDLNIEQANHRLKEFSKSLSGAHDNVIFKESICWPKKHTIQSFCTVATSNIKIEAAILIKSLRAFHEEPLYILCDTETKKFLEIEKFENVVYDTSLSINSLKETKEKFFSNKFTSINKYHKPECILSKMSAMDLALAQHDNTFFLDSDIVVLDSLQENFNKDIILSPHYHSHNKLKDSFEYGLFNAGYIFCADKTFPEFWRDIYLNNSTFFEQEGLNHVVENYDIQIFSKLHNYGFWRKDSVPEKVKSFHVHAIEKEFAGEKVLQNSNHDTRQKLFKHLGKTKNFSLKEYIENSEGKIWGGINTNSHIESSNSEGKINLKDQQIFWHHRSGWNYAIQALSELHNDNGIMFDGFLEKNFAWHYEKNVSTKKLPYLKPWVGFFHNPPEIPEWFFYENSVQEIIKKPAVKESLKHCLGLFALSEYHANFLRDLINVPVSALIHPSSIPSIQFSYKDFVENPEKKIINIGYWLRKLNSIYALPIAESSGSKKIRLMPYSDSAPKEVIDRLLNKERQLYYNKEINYSNTSTLQRIPDEEYDILLSKNIVFLDLYDSSANNAIIECIARATPILVNPIPAVKEYLGENYPFYFETLEEAASKALDEELVLETHEYLLSHDTRFKLSQKHFIKTFKESEVYKSL